MKPRALVVEDDPLIMPTIQSVLHSMTHRHVWVTNQSDARDALKKEEFDYVILDLQIPALPDCGGANTQYGLNLLRDIRRVKGQLPVLIMTAFYDQCVDMTTDLVEAGACDFIAKPFPTKGRTLTNVIESTLKRAQKANGQRSSHGNVPGRFSGGQLVFFNDRAELNGVPIISDRGTGQCLMVLRELGQRGADGRFVHLSAEDLRHRINANGSTNIAACVQTLRRNVRKRLAKVGVEATSEDVIQHDEQGYCLRDWIAAAHGDPTDIVAPTPPNGASTHDLNERQNWVLVELRRGAPVDRALLERRFGVTNKTAKRDLASLTRRGLITFVRNGRRGMYRLK
jgi:DNA-binding response OmpR family regulator